LDTLQLALGRAQLKYAITEFEHTIVKMNNMVFINLMGMILRCIVLIK